MDNNDIYIYIIYNLQDLQYVFWARLEMEYTIV